MDEVEVGPCKRLALSVIEGPPAVAAGDDDDDMVAMEVDDVESLQRVQPFDEPDLGMAVADGRDDSRGVDDLDLGAHGGLQRAKRREPAGKQELADRVTRCHRQRHRFVRASLDD
jgi:hypothetical protein